VVSTDMSGNDMMAVKPCECGRPKKNENDPWCPKCWCEWAEQMAINSGRFEDENS